MRKIGGIYKANTESELNGYFIPLIITNNVVYIYSFFLHKDTVGSNKKINHFLKNRSISNENFWYYPILNHAEIFDECGYIGQVEENILEKLIDTLKERSVYIDGVK